MNNSRLNVNVKSPALPKTGAVTGMLNTAKNTAMEKHESFKAQAKEITEDIETKAEKSVVSAAKKKFDFSGKHKLPTEYPSHHHRLLENPRQKHTLIKMGKVTPHQFHQISNI